MSQLRLEQIAEFYEHLDQLEQKVGGLKSFDSTHYINSLPDSGVEFYFEKGEVRAKSKQLRVVRIGASRRLMERLNDHASGNIERSAFCKHLKRALSNGRRKLNINSSIRERDISNYMLNNIQFLILPVSNAYTRKSIKNATIALLSNYLFDDNEKINQPTPRWLGYDCIDSNGYPYDEIIESGLWNVRGVDLNKRNFQLFLDKFEKLVSEQ